MFGDDGSYVRTGDVDTWVTRNGSGPPVLLMHGAFGDVSEWDSSLAELADRHEVIAYDRRGHGRTADVGDWDRRMLVADAVTLLDQLDVGRVDVVGYSDGGVVAAHLAATRPDLVGRLVLVSTAMRPDDWILRPEPPDPADPLAGLPDGIIEAYRHRSPDGAGRLAHVLERAVAFSAADHSLPSGALDGRVLLLAGDDDLVTLESQLELYRAARRGELAVVAHASHDAPREQPDLVTALVRAFLLGDRAPTHIPVRRAALHPDG